MDRPLVDRKSILKKELQESDVVTVIDYFSGEWRSFYKDLVVGGYTPGQGQRQPYFGALVLGAYDSGKLKYIVRVGSGFSTEELKELSSEFVSSDESPFSQPISTKGVRWLKPEMVVEVEALEVSKRGHLRAPVFLRTRDDKLPEDCTIDQLHTNLAS